MKRQTLLVRTRASGGAADLHGSTRASRDALRRSPCEAAAERGAAKRRQHLRPAGALRRAAAPATANRWIPAELPASAQRRPRQTGARDGGQATLEHPATRPRRRRRQRASSVCKRALAEASAACGLRLRSDEKRETGFWRSANSPTQRFRFSKTYFPTPSLLSSARLAASCPCSASGNATLPTVFVSSRTFGWEHACSASMG